MPVTMEQVRATLAPDEPDYERASELGPEALPHLRRLVLSGDPELASKATYLAGRIATEGSTEALDAAARSENPIVRVAAAEAVHNLPAQEASRILVGLVADEDRGVRRVALESIGAEATEDLRSRVAHISESDPAPQIRELATRTLDRLSS
jgi:HEAT repeat protein